MAFFFFFFKFKPYFVVFPVNQKNKFKTEKINGKQQKMETTTNGAEAQQLVEVERAKVQFGARAAHVTYQSAAGASLPFINIIPNIDATASILSLPTFALSFAYVNAMLYIFIYVKFIALKGVMIFVKKKRSIEKEDRSTRKGKRSKVNILSHHNPAEEPGGSFGGTNVRQLMYEHKRLQYEKINRIHINNIMTRNQMLQQNNDIKKRESIFVLNNNIF